MVTKMNLEDSVRLAVELAERFRQRQRYYDDSASFPEENFAELRAAGLHAMTVPEEYGGLGLWWGKRFAPYYQILEALARGDSSTAQLLQVHSHATGVIAGLGSHEQKQHYLGKVVKEGALIASVGSEALLTKSGPEVYEAELKRAPGGYRLTCAKAFASLGPAAAFYLLWVAVEGEGPYGERMSFAVVPRETPGIQLVNDWDTMGMRSTVSWSLRANDIFVPPEWVIGNPGDWARKDLRTFTLAYTANHLGTAQGAFDFICDYARQRPYLARDPVVQTTLGDMSSWLAGTRAALYAAAREWEEGDPDRAELDSIRALHLAKQTALMITNRGFDVCGARASFRVYPLEQALRDVRTFTLHFRDEFYMQIVARAELGEPFRAKAADTGSTSKVDPSAAEAQPDPRSFAPPQA